MANRFAFIVAWTDNYLAGMTALRNSIALHMPEAEIVEHHGVSVEDTAIRRFDIACRVGPEYDAVCLMDADMFLTGNCRLFFEIASAGFMVTGSNGMIIDFNGEYQKRYGVDLGVKTYPYPQVHTTAPIFLGRRDLDWFEALYSSRRIDHWDDFLYLNMLGISMGKTERMLCLPPYCFTGIHHWQMKPATAVFERAGLVLAGTEEQVYMVHGKWWDEAWLQDLMPTMKNYLRDEQIGDRGHSRVRDAIELMKRLFWKYHDRRW
jgi:hypothetical protein